MTLFIQRPLDYSERDSMGRARAMDGLRMSDPDDEKQ